MCLGKCWLSVSHVREGEDGEEKLYADIWDMGLAIFEANGMMHVV